VISKSEQERMWYLGSFALVQNNVIQSTGWKAHSFEGIKKWDRILGVLIKRGLLEADDDGMYRITDTGIDAVNSWLAR